MTSEFEAVIGLEIHVQLNTESKIFSSESAGFGAGDNENISAVSAGLPGTLPAFNSKALELAIKTGLALGCRILPLSRFARKNYFYPDLPKGYQISQHDEPLCKNGKVEFVLSGRRVVVNIERAHLEEDAGKSTHQGHSSLLNFNRAGVPLLEIVSAPDMRSAADAAEYARTIRQIVQYLDVCDGNLEEGSMRCDCNVSIRPKGERKLGTKVEIKNINSFRFIEKAIDSEILRQIDCCERGEGVDQETRLYDADKNRTFTMRKKENAEDYRYFPDPDIPAIRVQEEEIDRIKKTLPELPLAKKTRFAAEYGLPDSDVQILTQERDISTYFEEAARISENPKAIANWMMTSLLRELNESKKKVSQCPVSAKNMAELIRMIDGGIISGKMAKIVFLDMWQFSKSPRDIVAEKGLTQLSDPRLVEEIIQNVIDKNSEAVQSFRAGKEKSFGFLVGAVMKESKGKASPELVNEILRKKLDS
jgi:aspartyl-tRNA(Asn)/glutamyl-tRNA(Gln) amidotransferase subunit B